MDIIKRIINEEKCSSCKHMEIYGIIFNARPVCIKQNKDVKADDWCDEYEAKYDYK